MDQVWAFKLSCCGNGFQVTSLLLLQAIDEAAFSVAYANMCRCLVPVSKKNCVMTHWKSVSVHTSCFVVISHCNFYLNMSSQKCWFCCFIGLIVGPTCPCTEPQAVAPKTVLFHVFFAEKSGGGEGGSKERYILPQDSAQQMSERVWERKICWKENSWETGAPFKRRTNCKQIPLVGWIL